MFKNFGAGEILLILLVVLLLFGARRLPDAARGLGRSLRIFKSEVAAMNEDPDAEKPAKDTTSTTDTSDR
jgi:sec-independent protein translocase protein TatA